jgi:hypothetical protein
MGSVIPENLFAPTVLQSHHIFLKIKKLGSPFVFLMNGLGDSRREEGENEQGGDEDFTHKAVVWVAKIGNNYERFEFVRQK